MDPLHPSPMPTHSVLIGITAANSWNAGTQQHPRRAAYIATNSTQRLSFVSLQSAGNPDHVLRTLTRPAYFPDMPYGVVIELHLSHDLAPGETIYLALAQVGASTYYPPQPIDDAR